MYTNINYETINRQRRPYFVHYFNITRFQYTQQQYVNIIKETNLIGN